MKPKQKLFRRKISREMERLQDALDALVAKATVIRMRAGKVRHMAGVKPVKKAKRRA